MKNIKGIAAANDGTMKRLAITFDEIDEDGKIINSNQKINRVVTDSEAIESINAIWSYAQGIVDKE